MRILLLNQLFYPEPNYLKGLQFAKELRRRGHHVEVLTGFPNYPGGRFYPGYGGKLWSRETVDGITIHRVLLYPSHSRSGFARFVCFASFALMAAILGPFLVGRPDVIYVYHGPATLFFPAIVLRTLFRATIVLDIQDIWPESVAGSGMLGIPFGTQLIGLWCSWSYRAAHSIIVLSEGYKATLMERGVPAGKITAVYNWCDEDIDWARGVDGNGDGGHGAFTVLYAGAMGPHQGLEAVLRAVRLVQSARPDIRFRFLGGGIDAERLQELAATMQLKNVEFVPQQSVERVPDFIARCDALLIHLSDSPLCRIGVPSKTQASLAAGKPILVAATGETAKLVELAGAGVVAEPENPESIAEAVLKLASLGRVALDSMGRNGKAFYEQNLAFRVGFERVHEVLLRAA